MNLRSLIQPSEILLVELPGTHLKFDALNEEMEEGEHVRWANWYRWGLNFKSLIQPSEAISVKLTETHLKFDILNEEMEEGEHVHENIRNIKHQEAS